MLDYKRVLTESIDQVKLNQIEIGLLRVTPSKSKVNPNPARFRHARLFPICVL